MTWYISSDKSVQQNLQIIQLDKLNDVLGSELRWYEGQEAMWRASDMKNENQLRKLNEEILSHLHLYGELAQEKAENAALREKNARLQYEVEKLRLDVKACVSRGNIHAHLCCEHLLLITSFPCLMSTHFFRANIHFDPDTSTSSLLDSNL